jgi:predicted xylose isomerase-like sugar epimerase
MRSELSNKDMFHNIKTIKSLAKEYENKNTVAPFAFQVCSMFRVAAWKLCVPGAGNP